MTAPSGSPTLNQRVASGFRAELARTDLTQAKFAEHLGISVTSLRRRMNNEVSFTVDEVERGLDLFGIGPHELIREAIEYDSVRIVAREVFVERT